MHSFFESNLHIAEYVPFGLIIAIIIFTAIGWSVGLYRLKKYGESGAVIRDSLAAAIFGLSALVLGFTFSGSASRYVDRMDAIRVQAQTLQEVYGSLKYLSKNDQVVVKKSLDDLLDVRLTAYKNLIAMSDIDAGGAKIMAATRKIQEDVTRATLNASSENKAFATGVTYASSQQFGYGLCSWSHRYKIPSSISLIKVFVRPSLYWRLFDWLHDGLKK